MAQNAGEFDNGIAEIREARDQAQILRDQLVAEFERAERGRQTSSGR